MQPDITTTRYRTAPAPANLPCAENTTRTTTKHKLLTLLSFITLFSLTLSLHIFAAPPGSKYTAGETLDPSCAPGDTNCSTETTDDILDTFTGTAAITTLGTITSGTWNGTTIAITNGGTGATTAAAARTNLGLGNLEDSGAGVVNSAGGTGEFIWDNVRLNSSIVSSVAGDLELRRENSLYVDITTTGVRLQGHILPIGGGFSVGDNQNGFDSYYLGTSAFTGRLTGTFTADRTATFPDKTGTVAFTDDLIANLEDSGADVVNSASGTGYFQWDDVRLDSSTISNPSGSLQIASQSTNIISIATSNVSINTAPLYTNSGIFNTSGNYVIGSSSTNLTNGRVTTQSSQTNVDLTLEPKGSGVVALMTPSADTINITGALTADRTATFPDKTGTVAFTDDLLANLEDDGTNVQNSAAGTGSFIWENLSFNTNIITPISTSSVNFAANVVPNALNTHTLGTAGGGWKNVYIGTDANTGNLTGVFTADRTATFPDKTGTVAFIDDVDAVLDDVTITGGVISACAECLEIGTSANPAAEVYAQNVRIGGSSTQRTNISSAATAGRNVLFPDKEGTIAMTNDITGGTLAGSFTTGTFSGDVIVGGGAVPAASYGLVSNSKRIGVRDASDANNTVDFGPSNDNRGIVSYTAAGGTVLTNRSGGVSVSSITLTSGLATFSGGINIGGTTAISSTRAAFLNQTLIGITSARSNVAGVNPFLQVEGTSNSTSFLSVVTNQNTTQGGVLYIGKTRGTTTGSNTVVTSGDLLGDINFVGADGTNLIRGASIRGESDGTPGTNDMPGRLIFLTTADGASSPTEALRITSAQAVKFTNIGTTASAANAFLDSGDSNNLLRSTSSIRYKTDIQNITQAAVSNVITNLRPITYRSNAAADDPNVRWYGLIAEEVADIDPRLVHWITDEHGNAIPDGVQYERISVFLLAAAQDTEHRLSFAEASLASFDDILADLESLDAMTLKDKLIAWFGDVGNGIAEFVAGVVKAERVETGELCVDGYCVTREQLEAVFGPQDGEDAASDEVASPSGDSNDTNDEAVNTDAADVPTGGETNDTPVGDLEASSDADTEAEPAETVIEEEPAAGEPPTETEEVAIEEDPEVSDPVEPPAQEEEEAEIPAATAPDA